MRELTIDKNSNAAFGVFKSMDQAGTATEQLLEKNFLPSEIHLYHPTFIGPNSYPQLRRTLVQSGAIVGAGIGAVAFFILAVLIGLNVVHVSDLVVPMDGANQVLVVAVGLLFGLLVGAASGALIGIGTPQRLRDVAKQSPESNSVLLTVHVGDGEMANRAQDILEGAGAQDVTFLKENQGWESVYVRFNKMSYGS